MELKYEIYSTLVGEIGVLIVPFMELKLWRNKVHGRRYMVLIVPFMELKCIWRKQAAPSCES